jgi:hypothetical protein
MKKFLTSAVFCFVFAVAAFAQTADFSGTWTLDVGKSQLGERSRIESMTLTVTQAANELKVETATKRQAPPADAPQGGMGRGMGRGGFGGGDGTVVYSLDGKETTVEMDGPNGKIPVKYKASVEGGKANLSSSRTFSGPMGDVSITTKETWSLSDGGKTLTVVREQSTPRGTMSTTMVFVKK